MVQESDCSQSAKTFNSLYKASLIKYNRLDENYSDVLLLSELLQRTSVNNMIFNPMRGCSAILLKLTKINDLAFNKLHEWSALCISAHGAI